MDGETKKGESKMKDGYVNFKNRNWSFAGDKGTWAKIEGDELTVCRARRGTVSSDYNAEIDAFCESFGLDWSRVSCGQVKTIKIER
jgi:hypothetical protein